MKCNSYTKFFETIANPTRLKIVEALMKEDLSVTELSEVISEEQSKISHNLKCLADCNFLDFKKDGRMRIYSLNKDTIVPLMDLVTKHVETHCCNNSCKYKK